MTSTSNGRHSSVVESSKAPAVFSVAGELFVGNNLVQIDCSEIEWSFPTVRGSNRNNSGSSNNRAPKRENLLKFEQEILHKKTKRSPTRSMPISIQSPSTSPTSTLATTSATTSPTPLTHSETSRRRSEILANAVNQVNNNNNKGKGKAPVYNYDENEEEACEKDINDDCSEDTV